MNNRKQIIAHAIAWAAIIEFFLFITSTGGSIKYENVVVFVYFGILNIGIFYINYLYILPRFLVNQHYKTLAINILGLILISGLVKSGLAYLFKDIVLNGARERQMNNSFLGYYVGAIFTSTFFILLSTALRFSIDWFVNQKSRKNLENEKLTAELAFLKSQINPHFLLNSLNNIYSLAYQRAEKTPEAILKLAEIMRYMLYESNDAKVDLEKEIRYLENYIELQKIRYKDTAFVNFNVECEDKGETIVPLILIPFVENAFKHGVVNDAKNPVEIKICIENNKLIFKVANKKNLQNKDETGGIGFHNVKRRLDLLYPDKYKLEIDDQPLNYTCELFLDL